ncbi:Uu.00g033390.m01.CDS01 [Anthostomella pinea]|uniref:Uu.00g033390.m01.CDS01 n=1 Tax=Anthostomella pinea TaxID=933095 RepID=A0AAI8V9V8_9PEZI|nr:Uu.00g033390.m01.CDS01 [Anthostomella pinea]
MKLTGTVLLASTFATALATGAPYNTTTVDLNTTMSMTTETYTMSHVFTYTVTKSGEGDFETYITTSTSRGTYTETISEPIDTGIGSSGAWSSSATDAVSAPANSSSTAPGGYPTMTHGTHTISDTPCSDTKLEDCTVISSLPTSNSSMSWSMTTIPDVFPITPSKIHSPIATLAGRSWPNSTYSQPGYGPNGTTPTAAPTFPTSNPGHHWPSHTASNSTTSWSTTTISDTIETYTVKGKPYTTALFGRGWPNSTHTHPGYGPSGTMPTGAPTHPPSFPGHHPPNITVSSHSHTRRPWPTNSTRSIPGPIESLPTEAPTTLATSKRELDSRSGMDVILMV